MYADVRTTLKYIVIHGQAMAEEQRFFSVVSVILPHTTVGVYDPITQ